MGKEKRGSGKSGQDIELKRIASVRFPNTDKGREAMRGALGRAKYTPGTTIRKWSLIRAEAERARGEED